MIKNLTARVFLEKTFAWVHRGLTTHERRRGAAQARLPRRNSEA